MLKKHSSHKNGLKDCRLHPFCFRQFLMKYFGLTTMTRQKYVCTMSKRASKDFFIDATFKILMCKSLHVCAKDPFLMTPFKILAAWGQMLENFMGIFRVWVQ
jgi:hypothetical protein